MLSPYDTLLTTTVRASLAQSVERAALNRTVVGSSPTGSVFLFLALPLFPPTPFPMMHHFDD